VDADRIARAFALGSRARVSDGPVARGKQGTIWRLDTTDGRFAVKVPGAAVAEADVQVGTEYQEAAYTAGVPTPRVHRTTEGSVFADIDGARVRVYEWVDVLPPDPALDPGVVGSTVAAVHRTPDPEPHPGPVPAWYAEPVGADRWDELIDRLRAAKAPFADELARLRDELAGLDAWVAPPERVRTCHRDLWADNVRRTADGGACVVDWEDSGPADPAYELGCVLFEFGRGDPGRARALVDAYREAGGPARLSSRRQFSMLIAQLGHITEHAAEAWLAATPGSPAADRATGWVRELIDDPHTRRGLDDLLAGAGVR
jgi:Ser/Thr protein kinase RdoA (MazF antagonist)